MLAFIAAPDRNDVEGPVAPPPVHVDAPETLPQPGLNA